MLRILFVDVHLSVQYRMIRFGWLFMAACLDHYFVLMLWWFVLCSGLPVQRVVRTIAWLSHSFREELRPSLSSFSFVWSSAKDYERGLPPVVSDK